MNAYKFIVKQVNGSTMFYAGDQTHIANIWTTNLNLSTLFDTFQQAYKVIDVMAHNHIVGLYNVRMVEVKSNAPYTVVGFNDLAVYNDAHTLS